MRRFVLGVSLLIVCVLVVLVVFAATFNVNKYRGRIQSQLEQRLGRSVTLGDMHLGVFPPRFRVQNPAIGEDPQFSSDTPFVKAQELDVSMKLLPLLHKQFEVQSLNLERPTVNLIKNHSGEWNFASLGHSSAQPSAQTSEPVPSKSSPKAKPSPSIRPEPTGSTPGEESVSLGELTIQDGQISLLDQQTSKTPSLYDHVDVTLKDFSPKSEFTIDAAVHMAGSGTEEIRLQAKGGPIANNQPATTPFHGTLKLKEIQLRDFLKFLNSQAANGTDGIISGRLKLDNQEGKFTVQGETQVQNTKVRGMELGFPIVAQYDFTDDLQADFLTIRNLVVKLGSTPLAMHGTLNAKATPAALDLNVVGNNVSVAEAAKLAASSGIGLAQGTNATGTLNFNVQASGTVDKPALNGNVIASNVQLSGKNIAQPVRIPSLKIDLTPAQVQSAPFDVSCGNTSLNTQFAVRNYTTNAPTINAIARAPNAQLPAVLAVAKAFGVTSLDKVNGSGTMNLDMHAAGPLKSVNSEQILRALNGTIALNFDNVQYSGTNVSRELSRIAGFLNAGSASQSASGVTNISKVTGNIQVKDGIAETNDLQAKLDIGNVGATGTANLVDQALDLRVTAVLSQSASQKVGGNSVGGFIKTALANNQGELVVPAVVTGTFSNPRFGPDLQQIAQMKIKGLVPNLENPASVATTVQNLLGGTNPSKGQPQQQQKNQDQNPLQQLLGVFGKKQ